MCNVLIYMFTTRVHIVRIYRRMSGIHFVYIFINFSQHAAS